MKSPKFIPKSSEILLAKSIPMLAEIFLDITFSSVNLTYRNRFKFVNVPI